ncbi:mitochondrial import inner membrane translocase subunit Tim10 B [Hypanus sabinus]|uniref:mitochondrial import inner membrane translocase subunit Tim10 B n=1 Tax=Hypanus sabinus TaxID=79690 RepID=UPI0028C41076|nr:mitochondrial import inner membrane translocase subunit Tim10 B [Hypanus sabinus]
MAAEHGQLRNLRDFLLVYNKMTESCFNKCVTNLNYRNLTHIEETCISGCAGKQICTNHRLMSAYIQLMPSIVQKRMADLEKKAAETTPTASEEPSTGAE